MLRWSARCRSGVIRVVRLRDMVKVEVLRTSASTSVAMNTTPASSEIDRDLCALQHVGRWIIFTMTSTKCKAVSAVEPLPALEPFINIQQTHCDVHTSLIQVSTSPIAYANDLLIGYNKKNLQITHAESADGPNRNLRSPGTKTCCIRCLPAPSLVAEREADARLDSTITITHHDNINSHSICLTLSVIWYAQQQLSNVLNAHC